MGSLFRRKDSRYWSISYVDANGRRIRRSTKTGDKGAALQILAEAERIEGLKAIGVYDDAIDMVRDHAKRPITEQIEAYHLAASNQWGHTSHVGQERVRLLRLATECGWEDLRSINVDGLNTWLGEHGQLADATRASYVRLAKQFTKWAAKHRRLKTDPLAHFAKPIIRSPKFRRRALTESEWATLREYLAQTETVIRRMPPDNRRLLYEVALVTGLRSSELLRLRSTNVDLEKRVIRLRVGETKNRKACEQHLTPNLVDRLRDHIARLHPSAPLFRYDRQSIAGTLRADVQAARRWWLRQATGKERLARQKTDFLEPTDHRGDILDFHSLRHTCGAWLAARGIHPKAIQRVMRHSTIVLTMDTYGHLFPEQEAAALAALTQATSPDTQAQATARP